MSLSRFIKWGLTLGLVVVTSGCAWYQDLEWTYQEREERFGERSLIKQDADIKKFYELQKRINDLEQRLNDRGDSLHKPLVSGHESTAVRHSVGDTINQKAEAALAYIENKTRSAITIIDKLLADLEAENNHQSVSEHAESAMPAEANLPKSAPEDQPRQEAAIAGTLERDETGSVVGSTDQGNRYNYSVVYVYPAVEPWLDMWAMLEDTGVQDKWRGKNETKSTWFIYVGAYYTQRPAKSRSEQLVTLTGEAPEIRVRAGYQSVAMQ